MAVNKVVFGKDILIDLTDDTITPEVLKEGYTAHQSDGSKITGVMSSSYNSDDDDVDDILINGFTYGEVEVVDKGATITFVNETTGYILVKTFSDDICTAILTDSSNEELGKLVKEFSNDSSVITITNYHSGITTVKKFTDSEKTMTTDVTDTATGELLSSLVKKLV